MRISFLPFNRISEWVSWLVFAKCISQRFGRRQEPIPSRVGAVLLCSLFCNASIAQDTSRTILSFHKFDIRASLSASYTTSINYQDQDLKNYALNASLLLQDDLTGSHSRHQHRLICDLGYLKFIDSTWVKGVDRLQANLLWSRTEKKWTHSYSAVLVTQFLPDFMYAFDYEANKYVTRRSGGIFIPGTLELGYGATWYPWPQSSIQFAFATARINSAPKSNSQFADRSHFAETDNAVFDMQYGGSVIANIKQRLNSNVEWINASKIFCNGFDRDHVAFELMNKVNIKLIWYLQIRFDTRLAYDPLLNYDLRFGQDVLLGIFFEHPRKR